MSHRVRAGIRSCLRPHSVFRCCELATNDARDGAGGAAAEGCFTARVSDLTDSGDCFMTSPMAPHS